MSACPHKKYYKIAFFLKMSRKYKANHKYNTRPSASEWQEKILIAGVKPHFLI